MNKLFILLGILLLSSISSSANADGCMVVPNNYDYVNEPSQRAFIKLENGMETIVLQVAAETDAFEVGWIIPIPSYPEVTEADPELFRELMMLTTPKHRYRFDMFGGSKSAMEYAGPQGYIDVVTDTVGIYEVNKIRSNDGNLVYKWLDENNYEQPYTIRSVLDYYIHQGFCFLAVRVTFQGAQEWRPQSSAYGNSRYHGGWLDPLRIEFRNNEYFFPMKITSANMGPTDLEIWVIADDQMTFEDAEFVTGKWLQQRNMDRDMYPRVKREFTGVKYLSRLRRSWNNSSYISDDIYIKSKFTISDVFVWNWWRNK